MGYHLAACFAQTSREQSSASLRCAPGNERPGQHPARGWAGRAHGPAHASRARTHLPDPHTPPPLAHTTCARTHLPGPHTTPRARTHLPHPHVQWPPVWSVLRRAAACPAWPPAVPHPVHRLFPACPPPLPRLPPGASRCLPPAALRARALPGRCPFPAPCPGGPAGMERLRVDAQALEEYAEYRR